jgi:hypothetical protein
MKGATHELPALLEHHNSLPVFSVFRAAQSLVFCVVFCRSLFVLSSFDYRIDTRVVGALLANMVNFLHNTTNLDYGSVHLIGHSLGAHVCGYYGPTASH